MKKKSLVKQLDMVAHVDVEFKEDRVQNAAKLKFLMGLGWELAGVDGSGASFTKPLSENADGGGQTLEVERPEAKPRGVKRGRKSGPKPAPAAADAKQEPAGGGYTIVTRGDGTKYRRKKRRFFKKPGTPRPQKTAEAATESPKRPGRKPKHTGAAGDPILDAHTCPDCRQHTAEIRTCGKCGAKGCRERCVGAMLSFTNGCNQCKD